VGGRIVESGTHKELIIAGGRYAEAWKIRERG
jgi:ABC-type transport system involved in Fe-S cluster assembly fused permease/ATPase subunit